MSGYAAHNDFLKNSSLIDTSVEEGTYPVAEKKTVTREVFGKLATDVRARVKADADIPVFITEVETTVWLGDEGLTAENDYEATIRCNGVEKTFDSYSASLNFSNLLEWLQEDPETPVNYETED